MTTITICDTCHHKMEDHEPIQDEDSEGTLRTIYYEECNVRGCMCANFHEDW